MKRTLLVLLVLILLVAFGPTVEATDPEGTIVYRDQYSNTYDLGNGQRIIRLNIGSVNYETEDGSFLPIETTIVSSPKSDWDYEVETGHWQLYVSNDMTVKVVKDDNIIEHQLCGIAYYNQSSKEYKIIQTAESRTPIIDENTIMWSDVLYGVDYRLRYTNDSLKEDIIIKQELRDLLNTSGYTPFDFGFANTSTVYVTPIFRMDWSNALPLVLVGGQNVDRGNSGHERNLYFRSSVKDKYFNTNLVSYMPVDFAVSVSPKNPEAPEEEWEYSKVKIRKRLVTDTDGDWLLTGIKFDALSRMPEGDVVFDPTETLRPDAAGDVTDITEQYPDSTYHWDKVDEVVADAGTYVKLFKAAYIYTYADNDKYDLYNIPDTAVGTGTIDYVEVYTRSRYDGAVTSADAYAKIKTHSTEYTGVEHDLTGDYTTQSHQWTTNPYTSSLWTWDEIADLQIGVRLRGTSVYEGQLQVRCTQVYIELGYTPISVPTVTTQAANVTSNVTATGNGNITHIGGLTNDVRGAVWDTSSHADPEDTAPGTSDYSSNITEHGSFGTGAFTALITSLTQGTPYYYRTFAHNSEGYSYGAEVGFTSADVPTVATNEATDVAYTTARVNSTLTYDGEEECDVRFQYYEDGNPEWGVNTTWENTYTTGQQPYVDLTELTFNTLHHFRVQARNTYGTVSGSSVDFTTANSVMEPSNLKAFPEATSITLSWTKGEGATNTLIRYMEGTYPTSTTEGAQAYLGTSSSHSVTELSSGHTYYISMWGHSGTNYSDNYTTVMATTLPGVTAGAAPDAPDVPPTWFQTPDYTNFTALPFYDIINAFYDAYGVPRASGWFFSAILGCIVCAIFVFVISKHPMPAMVTLAVTFAVASLIKLLPMFMMAFAVIFMVGAFQLRGSR